jgi:hypothetical protein
VPVSALPLAAAAPIDRALGSGLFWAGIGVGFLVGVAYEFMRRAWSDYQKVKGSVPGMRKAAWSAVGGFVKLALIATVLVVVSFAWMLGKLANERLLPATVPTPKPPATSTR